MASRHRKKRTSRVIIPQKVRDSFENVGTGTLPALDAGLEEDQELSPDGIRRLRRSAVAYRELIRSIYDGLLITNHDGQIVDANSRAGQLMRFTRDEFLGGHVMDFLSGGERALMEDVHEKVGGEAFLIIEAVCVRKDGSQFPAEIAVHRGEFDEEGLLFFFIRDVSRRMRAEQQLRETMRELARSNADLEQFAYVASHDLKEPLRAITGYLELLSRRHGDQLDEQAAGYVQHATEGALNMRDLINHLLEYSRLERPVGEKRLCSIETVLKQAIRNLRSLIEEEEAVVTYDAMPNIETVPQRLVQVLQNLIANGIKFSNAQEPRVHVTSKQVDESWVFFVEDNGIGIPDGLRERCFIIFQRLHTRDEFPGSGIGLATCKKIVEQLGGKIWIHRSAPEEGTVVAFSLPT